jgi:hypothetical protein
MVHENTSSSAPRSRSVIGSAVSWSVACGKAWARGFVSFGGDDTLAGTKGYSQVMKKSGAVLLLV